MKFNKNNPTVYAFILTLFCIIILGAVNFIFFRKNDTVSIFISGMSYGVAVFSQLISRAVVSRIKKDDTDDSDEGSNTQHD